MHALLHILIQTTSTTKPKSGKSSSSSVYTLLFFAVVIGAVYLLFLRPRQQRMKQAQAARTDLGIGDPVMTAGGIHGTLVALDDDVAEVEVAPGVVLTFLRRAVSARPGSATAQQAAPVDDEWEIPSRSSGSDPDADTSTNTPGPEGSESADHTDDSRTDDSRTDDSHTGDSHTGESGDGAGGETGSGDSPDRLT